MSDLNERIAKVKGWYNTPSGWARINSDGVTALSAGDVYKTPDWSGNIADAWELVGEIQETGRSVSVNSPVPGYYTWDVRGWNDKTNDGRYIAHGEDAPEAICLAWLAIHEK